MVGPMGAGAFSVMYHDPLLVSTARSPIAGGSCRVSMSGDLARLAPNWLDLETRADANLFQGYRWCAAWAEAAREAGRPETPRILTVWQDDRLVLLWPLALRRIGPFRALRSFAEPATQYCDALIERGSERGRWLRMAWATLLTQPEIDALILNGVRSDAAIGAVLASSEAVITKRSGAPFAAFSTPHDAEPRRSAKTRNALRRHERNLAGHGRVEFHLVDRPAERDGFMCEAVRLKNAWLHHTGQVSAGYAHPANEAFLRRLAREDDFFAVRLSAGGVTAAVEAGILRGGVYWSLVQSYDRRFAAHAPGRLLFWHLVEHARRLGLTTLDFLAPPAPHKREWADGEIAVTHYVMPIRLRGRLLVTYMRDIRPRLKRSAGHVGRAVSAYRRVSRSSSTATP